MCLSRNAADLIENKKFPNLPDFELHIIIGVHEAKLINGEIYNGELSKRPLTPSGPLLDYNTLKYNVWYNIYI